jgi:hypothetical protein
MYKSDFLLALRPILATFMSHGKIKFKKEGEAIREIFLIIIIFIVGISFQKFRLKFQQQKKKTISRM